jgi:putative hemolysin
MRNLIEKESISRIFQKSRLRSEAFSAFIMKLMRYNDLNELYQNAYAQQPLEFIDKVFEQLNITVKVNYEAFEKLPKDRPFITVSNHPYGGIDGLILIKLFREQFPEYKMMVNYMLQQVDPLKQCFIEVNPFEQAEHRTKDNILGVRKTIKHLRNNHPLGIFPAGEVSTYHDGKIRDKEWDLNSIRFIKGMEVPVVPVYFKGANSVLFHLLGAIDPVLRTAKLPSELLNKRNKSIEVRIGYPIEVEEQQLFDDLHQFGRFLRIKTYCLGSSVEVKKFFQYSLKRKQKQQPIAAPTPASIIANELSNLPNGHHLFSSGDYEVYCTSFRHIPNTIYEIARLREITYREVGEGTNNSLDMDEFDLYYNHLIIWNKSTQQIVGGYRIGKGKDISQRYGLRGFYINQLFQIDSNLLPLLEESLELGRSYIISEYQKKPMPLFLLWKGILYFLLNNSEYRYLIGPVSMSNEFSEFSKSLIIEFLKTHYYHHRYARYVKPRNQYKVVLEKDEIDTLIGLTISDLRKLDLAVEQVEPKHLNVPVLFKKYLKENAKVLGFNRDPKFSNAIDGLLLLDLFDVPLKTIDNLLREMNDEEKVEAFNVRRNVSYVERAAYF